MVLCLRKISLLKKMTLNLVVSIKPLKSPDSMVGFYYLGGNSSSKSLNCWHCYFLLLSVPFHPMSQRTTYFGRKNDQVNLLECLSTCKGKILRKRPENILPQFFTSRVFSDLTAVQSLSERHYFFSRRLMLDVLVLV